MTSGARAGAGGVTPEITCTWCGCATMLVDDQLGLWLQCTICPWAVSMRVAPGDAR